ncbi:MAG: phosphoribosylglycinamide synthetase [Gammaproteobacteria bacterium]|jgi:biotin carboxylase|nr:phosphoribosylglycinamide synthetase [Gammaproteobacteria bacterium]
MTKAIVIVDAYSSGRIFPDVFKEKIADRADVVLIHVQSTPYIMSKMAIPEKEKYAENFVYTGDMDTLIAELSKYEVTAVLVGQEPGVELSDALSERLNLPTSNGTKMSTARRNKYDMIQAVADAGNLDDILAWKQRENIEYPVVLKVLRSASTDGVYICSNQLELERAFAKAIGHRTIMEEVNTEVLVESFLKGREYVVDAVSYDGKHYVTDVWLYQKRFVPGHGNIYDKEMLLPSDATEVQALIEYNSRMLDALEIKYGPSHAEIMLTPDQGPVLVEVGARINGVVHPKLHNLCLGHDQVHLTADCYFDPDAFHHVVAKLPYKMQRHAMIVNLINESATGTIELIDEEILGQMRALPSMVDMVVKVKPGQSLGPTRNLLESPVRFFMCHESEEQLQRDYETIQAIKGRLFRLRPSASLLSVPGVADSPQQQAGVTEKKHEAGVSYRSSCTL